MDLLFYSGVLEDVTLLKVELQFFFMCDVLRLIHKDKLI